MLSLKACGLQLVEKYKVHDFGKPRGKLRKDFFHKFVGCEIVCKKWLAGGGCDGLWVVDKTQLHAT